MAINYKKQHTGLNIKPKTTSTSDSKGDIEVLNSGKINYHDGTSNSPLVTEAQSATLTNKTIDADSNTITNIENADIKSGAAIDATKIADGSISNTEFQYLNGVTSNIQDQLDDKPASGAIVNADVASGANIDALKLGTGVVDNTEFNYLNGVTSSIQTQLNNKPNSGSIVDADISGSANIDASKLGTGIVSNTEFNYLDGVTSGIQGQFTAKADASALTAHTSSTSAHGVSGNIVGTTDAQILTNKDIDGGTASNTSRLTVPQANKATLDALTRKEGTIVYATDLDKYYLDNGSILIEVGTGSGGINYITTNDGTSLSGWATYADAAGTSPVDGTGGSPTITFATSADTTMRGANNFLLTLPASNVQGNGFSYAFTIDGTDKAKVLTASFDYQVASGAYVDDKLSVWIYDVTNSQLIQPSGTSIKNVNGILKQVATFQTNSNSTSYRFIVHCSSTNAVASTLRFDNFSISPQVITQGTPETDWVPYTPTITGFGTATNINFASRRVGDTLHVRGFFTAGTPTATEAQVTIGFNGANINVSTPSGLPTTSVAGSWARGVSATTNVPIVLMESSKTYMTFGAQTASTSGLSKRLGTELLATSDTFSILASFPIQGWSSNVQMSSDTDTRVVAGRFKSSTARTINNTAPTLVYETVDLDTHGAYNNATGVYTIPVSGQYKISANIRAAAVAYAVNQELTQALKIDGTTVAYLGDFRSQTTLSQAYSTNGSTVYTLKAGQTVTIGGYSDVANTTGSSLPEFNYWSIERISGPSQIAASESIIASYTTASAQSIPNSTATTVLFDTKVKDSHGSYNPLTGEFTCSIAGDFDVDALNHWTAWTGGPNTSFIIVQKDGVDYQVNAAVVPAISFNHPMRASCTVVNCIAGTKIKVQVYQDSGSAKTLQNVASRNMLTIKKVGN